jgi:hypothetical protein
MPDHECEVNRRLVDHVARLTEIEAALESVGFLFAIERPIDIGAGDPDGLRARAARLGELGERCTRAATASRDTRKVVELTWAAEELYAEVEELEAIAELVRARV